MRFHERHQIRARTATPSLTLLQDHQGLPIATDLPLHQVITDPLHQSPPSPTSTMLMRDHLDEIRTGSNQRGECRQKTHAHEQTAHRCTAVAAAQLTCYRFDANINVTPWPYITVSFCNGAARGARIPRALTRAPRRYLAPMAPPAMPPAALPKLRKKTPRRRVP